jgi:hypothetical protein
MKALGAPSMSRVNTGANTPKASASRPTRIPAVYCRLFSPDDEMIAFTGPVRQVGTAPRKAVTIAPAPQATAMASAGGVCAAERSTVIPWPFCTTSTVIASGTTSSTIARQEKAGL